MCVQSASGTAVQSVSVPFRNYARGSTNGYVNGRTNGCVLPWMTKWVWDNSISWEETSWNRINVEVGCPNTVEVQAEEVRGNVRITQDEGVKGMCVTPGDRLSSWWAWKQGSGWYCSKDGGLTYEGPSESRPLAVVMLVISAVVSCL